MGDRLSKQGLKKLTGPVERQVLFDIHAEAADSELNDEDEEVQAYDKIIRRQAESSEDLNDFISNFKDRKEGMESFQAFKLDARLLQLLEDVPDYDPQTVQVLDGIRYFSWDRARQILDEAETSDPQEEMYLNRLRTQSKKRSMHELADFALNHYRKKKMTHPDRVEAFESAAKKTFGTAELHEYQEVLSEVELLTGNGYIEELSRMLDTGAEGVREEAYQELRDVLKEAASPAELAAYTQDRIEFMKDRSPEVGEEMTEIVMEKYDAALPTTPIQ